MASVPYHKDVYLIISGIQEGDTQEQKLKEVQTESERDNMKLIKPVTGALLQRQCRRDSLCTPASGPHQAVVPV
jgi:hypothetical protein